MSRFFAKIFRSFFSFFKDVNITDDAAVLFRRNQVIRNIITISNFTYSGILMVIALSEGSKSNFLLSLLVFPFTFLISKALKMLIFKDPNSLVKQEVAMYVSSFYIFLSSILIYLRLKSESPFFAEGGYLLLYYSLLVIVLYQNKQLLKNMFIWIFFGFLFIHFTITYNVLGAEYSKSIQTFLNAFLTEKELHDIILRTFILIIFMIVSYSIVDTSYYMHEKRREDLIKRRDVEENFKNIVKELFNVVITNKINYQDNKKYINLIANLSKELASYMNLTVSIQEEIYQFSKCHIDSTEKLEKICNNFSDNLTEEEFYQLKESTEEGTLVVKRLQLSQKCEDIIKAHMEGINNLEFTKSINKIQNNEMSNIILFVELYVSLRSAKSFKRPYPHKSAVEFLKNDFKDYYDVIIFERFYKNHKYFEETFNNY